MFEFNSSHSLCSVCIIYITIHLNRYSHGLLLTRMIIGTDIQSYIFHGYTLALVTGIFRLAHHAASTISAAIDVAFVIGRVCVMVSAVFVQLIVVLASVV